MGPTPEDRAGPAARQALVDYLRFLQRLGWTHLPPPPEMSAAPPAPAPAPETPPAPALPPPTSGRVSQPPAPRPPSPPPETPDLFAAAEPAAAVLALTREERLARLAARAQELEACTRCKLCPERNDWAHRLVYGAGSPEAEIVFVGEGPGEEEDKQGLPFVGRAGELLTRIVEAMGLRREDVYICNVVKHRAPNNRDPEADEIVACEPFLIEQLDIVRPRVLVTLGNCATRTLLRSKVGITRLRGTWQRYHGIPTMPTYHPAYLLRSYTRENREAVWSDMRAVMAKLEEIRRTTGDRR